MEPREIELTPDELLDPKYKIVVTELPPIDLAENEIEEQMEDVRDENSEIEG